MQACVAADVPLVRQAWQRCVERLFPPLPTDALAKLFHQFIYDRYSEPQRHYHNLQHLEEMLAHLTQYETAHGWHGDYVPALPINQESDACLGLCAESHTSNAADAVRHDWTGTVLLLSILFHDAVYDPKRGDNEEKSAELAMDFLQIGEEQYKGWRGSLGIAALTIPSPSVLWTDARAARFVRETTEDYILKTKVHLSVEPVEKLQLSSPPTPSAAAKSHDDPLHVFLDLDLSILGHPDASTYRERYAANIQREYSHYPRADFLKGRSAFLNSFLSNPQWFKTPFFFAQLEAQARRNAAEEVTELTAELKEREVPAAPQA
ncbi:hypothetical protein ABB37_01559 [Leptomonas pyrrhocoris]|uniref:Uncharacterized protein n=1 Tax=Leptomonas pyrrhocoris TaxID=157538 RepID=A0A0N0DZE3_LEPPY|nr:hypothetical protein ABB37_01559 [Leptomonas pyrrhocoris]XP_015663632.1 hypothetical protein ABB37_01559 [Leptomonas pyrrhocoris]KPA85192.1 hypothetical protein ABB37_01559 [Leptomonas pyrrhocoris]KPA85193.1 hypothetical protein ABB37_01559 [Leptomonas pyrrhocoris]|eukprot:XP_015663631.1 hypothetical protein ABB37_01559 [Leptomonas pyrrhocoris]